ncbi:hypothetical protein M9458_024468, partial [Cirrhinus mrigala]
MKISLLRSGTTLTTITAACSHIRSTQDINQYFPQKNFTASWVFVVTWKYGPQQRP